MDPADAMLDALTRSAPVLLTGPSSPDGDSIGACLALARVLADRGVPATVAGIPPHRYRWMPGADTMVPETRLGDYAAVVVLDGDRFRLHPEVGARFARAEL